ncbi:YciI family protein [Plantactinospora siamensis]|uniref:YciI family protein n=1 Tax=Plantactinospora siamensis TaxID=555372 RepID=A0ABV6NTW8_9ACTN
MRYMLMHKVDEQDPRSHNPSPEFIQKMGGFIQEAAQAGVLLVGEGLRPTTDGTSRIRVENGKKTVTDGPFIETKELIAGFAILQVRSQEEAMEWGRRFVDLFDGELDYLEVDIRPVSEFEPEPAS